MAGLHLTLLPRGVADPHRLACPAVQRLWTQGGEVSRPIEAMCRVCGGQGEVTRHTSCTVEGCTRGLDYPARCPACAGTGWVPIDTIPGWARAQAEAIRADELRRHEAGLDADLAYQAFAGEEALR